MDQPFDPNMSITHGNSSLMFGKGLGGGGLMSQTMNFSGRGGGGGGFGGGFGDFGGFGGGFGQSSGFTPDSRKMFKSRHIMMMKAVKKIVPEPFKTQKVLNELEIKHKFSIILHN